MRTEIGVLFTSISIYGSLLLTAPVLSTIFAGQPIHLLYAAPLFAMGMGAFILFFFPKIQDSYLSLTLNCAATIISVFLSFWLLVQIQTSIDLLAQESLGLKKFRLIEGVILLGMESYKLKALFVVSLPFLFYGLFIGSSFHQTENVPKLYSFELLGIILGFATTLVFLESLGYQWVLSLIFFFGCLGLSTLMMAYRWTAVLLLVAALILVWHSASPLEPQRNLNWVSRDFQKSLDVKESRRSWTTFAKVQTLSSWRKGSFLRTYVSIGDGTGRALLQTKKTKVMSRLPDLMAAALEPKSALVLFAGAGSDMISLSHILGPHAKITGAEINSKVIEHALEEPLSRLPELLQNPNIQLNNQEGRHFLETTDDKFDVILYSWSGATIAHYSGAIFHTTQYLFTKEGLEAAFRALNKNGALVILGASKVNILLSLSKLREELKEPYLDFFILAPQNAESDSWKRNWDNNVLIVKKGKFTEKEYSNIKEVSQISKYKFIHAKNNLFIEKNVDELKPFNENLKYPDLKRKLNKASQAYFSSHSDDRPFVYSILKPYNLFDINHWNNMVSKTIRNPGSNHRNTALLIFFGCTILATLFAQLSLKRSLTPMITFSTLVFPVLGFFSGAYAIFITYLSLLYLGQPTHAMLVGQGVFLFSSFIGSSLAARVRLNSQKRFLLFVIIMSLFSLPLIFNLIFPKTNLLFFKLPYFIFGLTWVCILSLGSSFLFSSTLQKAKTHHCQYTSLYISINCLGGSLAAILSPIIVEEIGISRLGQLSLTFFAIGIFCFGVSLIPKKLKLKPS